MIMWLRQEWEAAEEEEEEDNIGALSQKRPTKETYQEGQEEEEDNVDAPHSHNLDKNQPAFLPDSKFNTSPTRRYAKRDRSVCQKRPKTSPPFYRIQSSTPPLYPQACQKRPISVKRDPYIHAGMLWLGSRVPIHTCMYAVGRVKVPIHTCMHVVHVRTYTHAYSRYIHARVLTCWRKTHMNIWVSFDTDRSLLTLIGLF
jgi:hypothetical protein